MVLSFGPFVLDRDRRLLTRDGEPVPITPKAFDLLVALAERSGTEVTKDELMKRLWPDTAVEEGNLTFQISALRRALGGEGGRFIATLPGRGYQFVVPAAATIARSSNPPSTQIRSLAVLPFKPLAAAQRDEALELGMADTLITRLGRLPGVAVSPISAVRRYSSLDDDPIASAKTLGVDAVLDGSIQRHGSRMRVTVRLLRAADGKPVWASQIDEDAADLFSVQDVVADRVARSIAPALHEDARAKRPTEDLEAYELYLKGRYVVTFDPEAGEEFFRRALVRDPRFAAAWAATAESWLLRGRYRDGSPRESFEKAREAATKAVSLDPALPEGHALLAQVYADHDWDWARAEQAFRRALELNPSSDVAHGQYAYLLFFRRDFDGALEHSRRATEIDPLSPMWAVQRGFILDSVGRQDEAIRHLEETLRLHPHFIPALLHLGMAHTNSGEPRVGAACLREAVALAPDSSQLLALEAWMHARARDREAALAILRDVEKRPDSAPAAHNLALAWTALGDPDRAFHWLDIAVDRRLFLARVVTVGPGFEPLRSDPRYAALVRRMGL